MRQVEANRANAKKSTGPATVEGKAASRRNSLEHGLAGEGVLLPDDISAAVAERKKFWRQRFEPNDAHEEWLLDQMVVSSVRVDFCQSREAGLQGYFCRRASRFWDQDRENEVSDLTAKLLKQPARTVQKLKMTKQGVEWMLGRWKELEAGLGAGGCWSESERTMALDLLGTAVESRGRHAALGTAAKVLETRELIKGEVESLENRIVKALEDLDEMDRSAAVAGIETETPRPISLLRRYEASCLRRLQWAQSQLGKKRQGSHAERPAHSPYYPRFEPEPLPHDFLPDSEPLLEDEAEMEEEAEMDEEALAFEQEILALLPESSYTRQCFSRPSNPPRVSAPVEAEVPVAKEPELPRDIVPTEKGNRRARKAAERRARRNA